jgi:hypothetical protein
MYFDILLAYLVIKYQLKYMPKNSIIKTFQKVEWVFENGQKKMSKIEKSKKVLKKTLKVENSDENALIFNL